MRNEKMTIWVMVVVLFASGHAMAWTQYNDGGTYDITTTINDDVWVDWESPGMQTILNLLVRGVISSSYSLQGHNDSRININGGTVGHNLYAYDNSHVTMNSGSVYGLYPYDNSQVTINGGSVNYFSRTYNNSYVTINGGSVNYLATSDISQVTMTGGSIGELGIQLEHNACLVIEGSNFAIDGLPLGFGEITSILGGAYDNEPYRRLTGTLANSDVINNDFRIGHDASIVLIPEPATILLLALGVVMLRKRK